MSSSKSISRRQFLRGSCAAFGAAVVACSGLGYLGTSQPVGKTIEPETCGEKTKMNQKILVTYATRCGSTAEVADAVGKVFCSEGYAVDIRPVKDVSDISGYQAVIVGGAVRYGQWLPEAVKFLEQNKNGLADKKTAFFAVHLMNQGEDETSRTARLAYLDAARKLVSPVSEAFFTGVGDSSKVSFLERIIAKAVKSPEGDFRNWDLIRGWAEGLARNELAMNQVI